MMDAILCDFIFNQDLSHFSVYLRFPCKWSVKWKVLFGGIFGVVATAVQREAAEGATSSGSQSYGTNRSRLDFPAVWHDADQKFNLPDSDR